MSEPSNSAGQAAEEPATSKPNNAKVDWAELYEQVKNKPCSVNRVILREDGKPLKTNHELIDRELQRIQAAKTLEEIQEAAYIAGERLKSLQVFSKMDILIDEGPEDEDDVVDVTLSLSEKQWWKARAAAYADGGETHGELSFGVRNISGWAEQINVAINYGAHSSNEYTLDVRQPMPWGLPVVADVKAFQQFINNQRYSSYTQELRGGTASVSSLDGVHTVGYDLGWQRLVDPTRVASKAVRLQMGDYLKSTLRYTYLKDQRDNPAWPSAGWAFRSSSEVGGLSPDVNTRFVRQQIDIQHASSLNKYVALNITLGAGLLLPWTKDGLSKPTLISERFFLGTLRGFAYKGAGPSDVRRPSSAAGSGSSAGDGGVEGVSLQRDSLGGDLYASVLATANFKLPHPALQALGIHGHAFVNGGSNILVSGTKSTVRGAVEEFGSAFRWSTGFGLVIPSPLGRFEANYVRVLSHQQNDSWKHGIQFGFASSPFMA